MNKVTKFDKEKLDNIGERIKSERTKRNLSQDELSKKITVTRQKIINFENNTSLPDARELKDMADEFNVSVDYLLGRVQSKKIENKEISSQTGLSDEAIAKLSIFQKKNFAQSDIFYGDEDNYTDFSTIINSIVEDDNFNILIYFIRAYINSFTTDKLDKIIKDVKAQEDLEYIYDSRYTYKTGDVYLYKISNVFNRIIEDISSKLKDSFSTRWVLNKEKTKILKKCYDNSEKKHGKIKLEGGIDGNVRSRNNKK